MQVITKIQDLAPQANNQPPKSSVTTESHTTPAKLSDSKIDQFFIEMNAIYGARWRSNFIGDDGMAAGKAVWAQKLSGLTNKQLRRGVDTFAALSDWNPSISEFLRAACRLPSLNQCLSRVIDEKNNDPVSYKISSKIGAYSLSHKSFDQIKSLIQSHYDDAYAECLIDAIGNDEEFKPVAALPKDTEVERPSADPSVAIKNLKSMHTILDK